MSIDELADVDVWSVSKTPQPLSDAAASIYVIDHEDIVRSGATTIPEILRLAPNLEVYQTSSSGYVVTARGQNGNPASQSYANKLLVLIDGRSVYSPLFSGVFWDMQDALPDDIDRIEIVSGPGATLWGANAVNGVINIITKRPGETQGALVEVQAGAFERNAAARYGGKIGETLRYRFYVRAVDQDQTRLAGGGRAHDGWSRIQGGFRLEWTPNAQDMFTLQGDAYGGGHGQLGAPDENISGRNLLARWSHTARNGNRLQVQGYYDFVERRTENGGGYFLAHSFDFDVQHSLSIGSRNRLVWGGGVRATRIRLIGNSALMFRPRQRTLVLGNIFAQDTFSITPRLDLIGGLKLEKDPYVGVSLLPSARVSWKPVETLLLWGAASRAVRSPTPFDVDVVEQLNGMDFLVGNKNFRTEKLTAFELGTRIQATSGLSLSVSGFYNLYDDLRSVEFTPVTLLPLHWGNKLKGHSYGLDAWIDYRVASWWKISAGARWLREKFHFKPGATGILGLNQNGNDPRRRFTLRSSMTLGRGVTFDAHLRAISKQPDPHVPAYAELGGRIAWALSPHIELSLTGTNLLHKRHIEYAGGAAIPRRILAGIKWRP
jgi:iron complex outermembrane receptor protein